MKQTCSNQLTDKLITNREDWTTNQLVRGTQLWICATQAATSIELNRTTWLILKLYGIHLNFLGQWWAISSPWYFHFYCCHGQASILKSIWNLVLSP